MQKLKGAGRMRRLLVFYCLTIFPFGNAYAEELFGKTEMIFPHKKEEAEIEDGASSVKKAGTAEDRWKLDAGGQVRLRGDFARNQNFTDFAFTPGEREAQFLQRTRIHGSVENPALGLKGFAQGQWYGRWGGIDNRSEIDLYQGFIEWNHLLSSPLSLKAGRQDFSYGSTFFLGPNDFYNGLSWDGLQVNIRPNDAFQADILGVKMSKLNSGDPSLYLTGVYSTYQVNQGTVVDGYFFYHKGGFPFLHREFEIEDSGQKWFTLGIRLAGKVGGFDYELEPQVQWGRVKNPMRDEKDEIRAYGGHVDLGYTFPIPWEPRVFAAYAYGSGDSDPFDGKYREYHGNVFNDNYLVGDMSVIADLSGVTVNGIHASGIQAWVAGISVNPLSNFNLNLDIHFFRASKVPQGLSRDLGTEVNLFAAYKLGKRISFLAGLNKFFTGRFFEQASGSGKNINYGYIQGQVEF
jgi:Alginate export